MCIKGVVLSAVLLIGQVSFAEEEVKSSLKTVEGISTSINSVAANIAPVIKLASAAVPVPADSRPWQGPDFRNQKNALGYTEGGFVIPKAMENKVNFWVDIYTKYTTDEGVIHDMDDVEKVYQVVDIKGLKTEKEKQKKIDAVKKEIATKFNFSKEDFKRLRFQLGQKNRMQEALFNSGRYIEQMEKVFREANLPAELTRLAFVESAFNVMARSKVGASGIWQIMPYTARPYRLINAAVDNRNHPLEATKFAAKLLKQNYSMLESWPLAITGYNHGPTGVKKMTLEYKSRELSHLIENVDSRKSFGFASRNFYACFLAVLEIERNAKRHFPNVVWAKPFEASDLKLPITTKFAELVNWFDGDSVKAQIFNPHLTSRVVRQGYPIPARTVISVPKEKVNIALISLAQRGRSVASEVKKMRP